MKEITDLGLIAALIVKGFTATKRKGEGKQVIFIFEDTPDLSRATEDYFNHVLMVDAFNMHMTLKQVKSSIFQMEK